MLDRISAPGTHRHSVHTACIRRRGCRVSAAHRDRRAARARDRPGCSLRIRCSAHRAPPPSGSTVAAAVTPRAPARPPARGAGGESDRVASGRASEHQLGIGRVIGRHIRGTTCLPALTEIKSDRWSDGCSRGVDRGWRTTGEGPARRGRGARARRSPGAVGCGQVVATPVSVGGRRRTRRPPTSPPERLPKRRPRPR